MTTGAVYLWGAILYVLVVVVPWVYGLMAILDRIGS